MCRHCARSRQAAGLRAIWRETQRALQNFAIFRRAEFQRQEGHDLGLIRWDNPTVTVVGGAKKRVVLPSVGAGADADRSKRVLKRWKEAMVRVARVCPAS